MDDLRDAIRDALRALRILGADIEADALELAWHAYVGEQDTRPLAVPPKGNGKAE